MAAELLKNLTGIDIVHVPYKGSTGMRTDIISGQIQMLFDSVPTMAAYVKDGRVRALGTSGTKRSPILPDVPTIAETVPGFQATLVGRFHGAERHAEADRRQAQRRDHATSSSGPTSGVLGKARRNAADHVEQPEFDSFMQAEVDKWAKVIKDNHIALIVN